MPFADHLRASLHKRFRLMMLLALLHVPLAAVALEPASPPAHYERFEPYRQGQGDRQTGGPPIVRGANGRIARSAKARHAFKQDHPCPATGKRSGSCKGYTIDHIVPLKRGGADHPLNMQWQTNEEAKAKDRIE